MGSPKKAKKQIKQTPEPKAPTIAEKLKLLELGEFQKDGSLSVRLTAILDGLKEYIQELVPWLDSELSNIFRYPEYPASMKQQRGMLVFEGHGRDLPTIALSRTGEWIIPQNGTYVVGGSAFVAGVLVYGPNKLHFAAIPISRGSGKGLKTFIEENATLRALMSRRSLVWFTKRCFETIDKTLKSREERLKLMRERVNELSDFSRSFDPLRRKGCVIELPEFGIYEENENGVYNRVNPYIHEKALEPFYAYIKSPKRARDTSKYKTIQTRRGLTSLKDLFERLSHYFSEIEDAEHGKRLTAEAQCFCNSGRLAFSPEELIVLKNLVERVAAV